MQISLTGRHFEVTDSVRAYVDEKIGRLEKFSKELSRIEVVLKNEGRKFHCEFIMHVKGLDVLVIDVAHGESMHAAIDLALDKAENQLRRNSEKKLSRRREHVDVDMNAAEEPAAE